MQAGGLGSWCAGKRKVYAGRGVRDPRFGRPCSRLSRRGQQQAGELLLPGQPGLSKRCAVVVDHKTGEDPLRGEGKAALQESPGRLGGSFSTHQVLFRQPKPPRHPCSVPTFVWFLCLVCLCKACNVFQMRLCATARAFVCFLLDRRLWPVM